MDSKLGDRSSYIGGSDIPSIFGFGYSSPLELFLIKRGELRTVGNLQTSIGKALEPIIQNLYLKKIEEEESASLWEFENVTQVHPKYPFLIGHLDGFCSEKKVVVEFKATRFPPDGFPIPFQLQVAFYSMLTDAAYADVAILFNTTDFQVFRYQRNQKLENIILQKALEFWERLKTNNAPPISEIEDVRRANQRLHALANKNPMTVDKSLETYFKRFEETKVKEKELSKELNEIKMAIHQHLGAHEMACDDNGSILATYKFDKKGREMADMALLKKDFPEVWEQVKKVGAPARRLIVK